MLKKLILLGLFILSLSFTSLAAASEPNENGDKPNTEATVQADSSKQDADKDGEKDCCKKNHQQHDKEQNK
jgi:hypothetical protein